MSPRKQIHLSLRQFRDSKEEAHLSGGLFSLDFEANTQHPHSKDLYIRSVAMSNDDLVVGVDFLDASSEDWSWFLGWVYEQQLIVFNGMYDCGLLYNKTGKLLTPHADCYIAFKMLGAKKYSDANIGHGLKAAQTELLGWEEKGNNEIAEYMKDSGLWWSDIKKFDSEILLRYNCYDADSTWQLYTILRDFVAQHMNDWGQYFAQWHQEDCLSAAEEWIEALHDGMPVDIAHKDAYREECEAAKDKLLHSFFSHPQLRGGIEMYNKAHIEKIWENPPKKYKKGSSDLTHHWKLREKKYEEAVGKNHFNINSVQQLRWLLYGYAKLRSPKPDQSTDAESLGQLGEIGEILLNIRYYTSELKFLKQLDENIVDNTFHPSVVFPGTDTGRVVSREDIG